MPLPLNRLRRSREIARPSECLDMRTVEREPNRRYRKPGGAPSEAPSRSNPAAGKTPPEFSSAGLSAIVTSSSGFRAGEDIVIPICDIRTTGARIVIPENTQRMEAESFEFLLYFFGSREVDSHPAVCRIHQVSFTKPKRASWHSPRDASQRPDDRLKSREYNPQAREAPDQRPIQNRVAAHQFLREVCQSLRIP